MVVRSMLAAVYYQAGDIRLETRPKPRPKADAMIARVLYCALCGTDVKLATIGHPRCHPPRIIGHEMVGRLETVGSGVRGFAVGDRVTLATTVACGRCPYCAIGLGNLCPDARPISFDFDGALAEYILIPPEAIAGGNVIKLPAGVSDAAAALSEPLSCAVNAQELAGVRAGDTVAILGGGPLGALHAELARALGAAQVLVVGHSQPRLTLLRRLQGVTIIDASKEHAQESIRGRTGGLGADHVIVCAPTREAHEQAPGMVRKGGSVVLFASLPKGSSELCLDSRLVHYGELRVIGSSDSRPEHVARAVALLAGGGVDAEAVITHTLPLRELHAGLELMISRQSLKVLLQPQGEDGG
jgi:L-iditol 2-dehydrogenase